MIVTAALVFFDEEPTDLAEFAHALLGAVDRLVAVDGAYERYPHKSAQSNPTQLQALKDACADIGLPLELHTRKTAWRGQVEKRDFLLQKAAEGSDWVFTLDADHILRGVREAFRQELARVTTDRVDLEFYTTVNPSRPMSDTSATEWHSECAGETRRMGLLVRVLPEMRYESFHWWISALKNDERIWVYGGDDSYPKSETHELEAPFFIEHRCHFRRDRSILGNRAFCEDRVLLVEATGQEDAVAA